MYGLVSTGVFMRRPTMNSQNRTRSVTITRKTNRLMRPALLAIGLLVMLAAQERPTHAAGKFKRLWSPMYIAALADPGANSGAGAQSWGLWRLDPGPRGVRLNRYERLKAAGGVA